MSDSQIGTVYTDTVIWAPPEKLAAEAPYQLAIIELPSGKRITARIKGERVLIGERVSHVESREGISYFRKTSPDSGNA